MLPKQNADVFINEAVSVEKPVRWSKDRLAKLEDLELALDAAVHVNRHLNKEIEIVVQQLQRAEQERHAWQQHARRLAKQLAKYKHAAGADLSHWLACCIPERLMMMSIGSSEAP